MTSATLKVEPRAESPRALIHAAAQRLHAAGVECPRHDAEWLLGQLLNAKPLELYLQNAPVSPEVVEQFFAHVAQRAAGVPLQYLLGEAEFFGEQFITVPGVFIPRPETETVVEAAIQELQRLGYQIDRPLRLLDAGTGTGCIALTLAKALPACVLVGVEVSWIALRAARRNVKRHGLTSRVHLVQGRWTEPFRSGELFDGLISNPPYIPSAQVDRLPLDVRHEPRLSLDGGEDGLRDLRELVASAPRILAPGGICVVECGEEQVDTLSRLARSWFEEMRTIQDLAGRPRGVVMVCARRNL